MEKTMKIAVVLSAYDKMSTVINTAFTKAEMRMKGLQKYRSGLDKFGNAAAIGGGIATAAFASTLKAAEDSEVAGNRLKQVFKSMGEANDGAANAAMEYASQLQSQIGIEDEVINAAQAKIATFKSVSDATARMAGIFDRATEASFDMQATGFGDASQNAVQLGKALEDPIKGINSLRRSGITFTAQERKKIQALVDSGDKLKAQNIILKAVEKQVGGVAKSTATTSSKIRTSWSEVSEGIGKSLLPAFQSIGNMLAKNVIPKIVDFAANNPKLVKTLAAVSVALLVVGTAAKVLSLILATNPIVLIIMAIAAAAILIYSNWGRIKEWFAALWDKVKSIFSTVWNFIKNLFLNYTPYGLVIKHWDKIKKFFSNLWDNVTGIFSRVWEWIKNMFLNYTPYGLVIKHWDKIKKWFHDLWENVTGIFSRAWKKIKDIIGGIWNGVKKFFGKHDEAVDKTLKKIEKVQTAAEGYQDTLNTVNGTVARSSAYTVGNAYSTVLASPSSALKPVANNSNDNSTMNYSPTINVSGGATEDDAALITSQLSGDFEKQMKRYQSKKERVSFNQ
jgi:hypothetical protein